jgi:hypothetical protein
MAEKHKSKYKKPENAKPTRRKDIKDYTHDDKAGAMNPYSTGKKQEKVARKTDKPFVDDSKNLTIKMTDKDRLYKKIEDGEYDPKHAMNVLRKRQEVDTDEYFDAREKIDHGVTTSELKERINKLSASQKERLVREYVRRKIAKIIQEQGTPTDAPEEEAPAPDAPDAPAPDAPDAPAPDAPDALAPDAPDAPAPDAPDAPAPDASAAPTTPAPAPNAAAPNAPQAGTSGESQPEDKEEQQSAALDKVVNVLSKEAGNVGKAEFMIKAMNKIYKDADPVDSKNFYKLLRRVIDKKLIKMSAHQDIKKND